MAACGKPRTTPRIILCTGACGPWCSLPTRLLSSPGPESPVGPTTAQRVSSDKAEYAAACFSQVLSLWCLSKRKKNLPKRQSQIGVIPYDSEAEPVLVSEFPPSCSRRPLLTSNMAIPRFQTGFASGFQCNFSGAPALERVIIDTLHPSAIDGISF